MATTQLALASLFGNPAVAEHPPIQVTVPAATHGSHSGAGRRCSDDDPSTDATVFWAVRRK